MAKTNYDELKKLSDKLDNFIRRNTVVEEVAKALTARLLEKVIPRTPVGQYPKSSGKVGGTLRRGWTSGNSGQTKGINDYVNSLSISKSGKYMEIPIINPVEYASFVEQGHRTRGGGGWVPGRHMLRISISELKKESPKIIQEKLVKELGEVFK